MVESLGVSQEIHTPDSLIAGHYPLISKEVTLIAGQNLTRGALLGKITASGKYNLSLSAAVDGSEVPTAVLAKDTDATAADVVTVAYESGEFNDNKIIFGAAHTAATVEAGLRDQNIYLKTPVKG